jgi:hypothetical protein
MDVQPGICQVGPCPFWPWMGAGSISTPFGELISSRCSDRANACLPALRSVGSAYPFSGDSSKRRLEPFMSLSVIKRQGSKGASRDVSPLGPLRDGITESLPARPTHGTTRVFTNHVWPLAECPAGCGHCNHPSPVLPTSATRCRVARGPGQVLRLSRCSCGSTRSQCSRQFWCLNRQEPRYPLMSSPLSGPRRRCEHWPWQRAETMDNRDRLSTRIPTDDSARPPVDHPGGDQHDRLQPVPTDSAGL